MNKLSRGKRLLGADSCPTLTIQQQAMPSPPLQKVSDPQYTSPDQPRYWHGLAVCIACAAGTVTFGAVALARGPQDLRKTEG